MDRLGVFQAALGISEPWRVTVAEFDPTRAGWTSTWTSSSTTRTCTTACPGCSARPCGAPGPRAVGQGGLWITLFEPLLVEFAVHILVAAIARMVRGGHDTSIWRVLCAAV